MKKGQTERVSSDARDAVKAILLRVEAWELVTQRSARRPSWGKTLDLLLTLAEVLPPPDNPIDQSRLDYIRELFSRAPVGPRGVPPARSHSGTVQQEDAVLDSTLAQTLVDVPPGAQALARSLHRLVYTEQLLTLAHARRYCDLLGIPRSALEP